MKPVYFKEADGCLRKPDNMSDEECSSLPVCRVDGDCISKWKLTWKDRLRVLFYGTIWLAVHSGSTQPPVWMSCHKTVFAKEPEHE